MQRLLLLLAFKKALSLTTFSLYDASNVSFFFFFLFFF